MQAFRFVGHEPVLWCKLKKTHLTGLCPTNQCKKNQEKYRYDIFPD